MSNENVHNRIFKHKYFKDNVIKAVVKEGSGGMEHLYIQLVKGDEIKGMAGNEEFMLSTCNNTAIWEKQLKEFTHNNQYIEDKSENN